MIAIIDYDMGNLMSVEKAFAFLGFDTVLTANVDDIRRAEKIVLPGVGAFGDAMKELAQRGLVDVIRDEIEAGKPFLGICIGLQVLFDRSEEAPGVEGLSIIPGEVVRFRTTLKVPHMGWNSISIRDKNRLLEGVDDGSYVYFVHSYSVVPSDSATISTVTDYDGEFVSSIHKDNLFAMQFHPEKSQKVGLKILRNFGNLGG